MFAHRRWCLKVSLFLILGVAALGLNGCKESSTSFNNVEISGKEYGQGISLTDQYGKVRTFQDFPGKVVAVFFGYTQCPDVCPTTLVQIQQVMQLLGKDANRMQVLFVTLDPERDSAELLGQYMGAFNVNGSDFLGLRASSPAQTAAVAKSFGVFYEKHKGSTPNSYLIDHTAGIYLFDPQGRARLFVRQGETVARISSDIALLLAGK